MKSLVARTLHLLVRQKPQKAATVVLKGNQALIGRRAPWPKGESGPEGRPRPGECCYLCCCVRACVVYLLRWVLYCVCECAVAYPFPSQLADTDLRKYLSPLPPVSPLNRDYLDQWHPDSPKRTDLYKALVYPTRVCAAQLFGLLAGNGAWLGLALLTLRVALSS
jgi:hypothetical protein